MVLSVIRQDLFSMPSDFYLAHCISGDFALGAGIAKQFQEKFNMREKLKEFFPEGGRVGDSLMVGRVFNLVTKEKYWQKPTYSSLRNALLTMRYQCSALEVSKLAMPKIGCGLDRLDWGIVKDIIAETFEKEKTEIVICVI